MIDLGSHTIIEWTSLIDNRTGDYVNTATITGALKDSAETTLGTFSLSYVDDSDGDYQGVITPAMVVGVSACDELYVELTATNGGYTSFRRWTEVAGYREKM